MKRALVLALVLAGNAPALRTERALRQAIAMREAAQARHDVAALRTTYAPNFTSTFRSGDRAKTSNADESAQILTRLIAARPDLRLRRAPDTVVLGSLGANAVEQGRWTERWSEADGGTVITGRYLIVWIATDSGWRQAAELFTPLSCTGSSYCKR